MRLRVFAAGLAVLLGGGAAFLLLRGQARTPTPAQRSPPTVIEPPRAPVASDSPITLRGRLPPRPPHGAEDRSALVHERDEAARAHTRLLQGHVAGRVSIHEVEVGEMRLLDARHELGEVDGPAWHRARAALYANAIERAHVSLLAGFMSVLDAKHGVVLLERERLLAGGPNSYAEKREDLLEELQKHRRARVEAGVTSEKEAGKEHRRLEVEFPHANEVSDLPPPREPAPDEKTEFLLAMDGGDLVTELFVARVLDAHGIWSLTAGSLGWSTSVRTNQRAEAERLIRQEAGLRGFVTWLPSGERESAALPTQTTVRIGKDYAAALDLHPPQTVLGRILRSEDLRDQIQGYSTAEVVTVRWAVRPLVTATLKPTAATVATVMVTGRSKEHPHPTDFDVVLEDE